MNALERILFVLALTRCCLHQRLVPFPHVSALETSLLMIGNSFTEANELEDMIVEMLKEDVYEYGGKIYSIRFRKPASRLAEDVLNPALHSTIAERNWNWVVLQEQSQIPAFIGSYYDPTFQLSLNATTTLNQWIAEVNAETILLMTWGRRGSDFMYPELFPDFQTMQDLLVKGYSKMQSLISTPYRPVRIAPAGLAFQSVHDSVPGDPTANETAFSRLYAEDGVHPSVEGSYLIACVVYATITGKDPRKLTRYLGPPEIPADIREGLRGHAEKAVTAFNQENEYNRQYFAQLTVMDTSGKDVKPYVPPDQKDKNDQERSSSSTSRHFWWIFAFGMAGVAIVYMKKRGFSPKTAPPLRYDNAVDSPEDLELVDMPQESNG